MIKFIIKRLLALIPVLVGVSLLVFFILDLAPGDPAKAALGEQARPEDIEAFREEMGLNDPFIVRYVNYMLGLCQGDLGISYKTRDPVGEEVWARLPNTAMLALTSTVVAILLALPLGIIAAIKQNTLFFSVKLGWFPVSGADQGIKSLVLPSIALGFMHMASIARTTRSSMLETIRQDYLRTVRAKGLPEKEVITRHALRNALIPTTTVIGLQIGGMLGGSVLTESVFAWPGIGRYMIQSIQGRDIPSVMGCIIIFALSFAVINLIVDLIYGFIDPRIKAQYK